MAGMNIYPFLGMFKNGLNEEIIKQTGGLGYDEEMMIELFQSFLMVLKRWSLI
jgi:hypothetical protein